MGPYKALFFDLDDTLCAYWDAAKAGLNELFEWFESEIGISQKDALNAWVQEFRAFCPFLREQGWYAQYLENGETTRTELMRRVLNRLKISNNALATLMSERYFTARQANLKPFPETIQVLDFLCENHYLGLITNGPADTQNQQIDQLGIRSYFEIILIEGELRFGKPDKRVLKLAEFRSGFSAKEILFIGNSYQHDILPAIEQGWDTFWIRRASDIPPSAGDNFIPETKPDHAPVPTYESNSLSMLLT